MVSFLDLALDEQHEFLRIQNYSSWDEPEEIACPRCESVQQLNYEDVSYEDGEAVEHTCNDCGYVMSIVAHVSYAWSTELNDEEVIQTVLERRNDE